VSFARISVDTGLDTGFRGGSEGREADGGGNFGTTGFETDSLIIFLDFFSDSSEVLPFLSYDLFHFLCRSLESDLLQSHFEWSLLHFLQEESLSLLFLQCFLSLLLRSGLLLCRRSL
jgi:hypothetical protein